MPLPLIPWGHCCALQGMSQCKEEKELESQLENDRPATFCSPPSFPGQCPNLVSHLRLPYLEECLLLSIDP